MFNDHSVNDTLTNDIVSFEQLGPECLDNLFCPFFNNYEN